MHLLFDYLWAVLRNWWGFVPGMVVVIWDLFERSKGAPLHLSRNTKITIAVVGILVAQFFAYRSVVGELEKTNGEIDRVHRDNAALIARPITVNLNQQAKPSAGSSIDALSLDSAYRFQLKLASAYPQTAFKQDAHPQLQLRVLSTNPAAVKLGDQMRIAFGSAGWSVGTSGSGSGPADPVTNVRVLTDFSDQRSVSAVLTVLHEFDIPYSLYKVCDGMSMEIEIGGEQIRR